MCKSPWIQLLLLALEVVAVSADTNVKATLVSEVNKLAGNTLSSTYVVNSVECSGSYDIRKIATADLGGTLAAWKLPKEVVANFQSFHFQVNGETGVLDEYVGAGRNPGNGNDIEVAYMYAHANGNLNIQKETHRYYCGCGFWFLFWMDNHYCFKHEPRSFTTAELGYITKTLRYHAYSYLKTKLNSVHSSQHDAVSKAQKAIFSPRLFTPHHAADCLRDETALIERKACDAGKDSSSLIEKATRSLLAKVPSLKKDAASNSGKSTVVDKIVGKGFTEFDEHVTLSQVKGVQENGKELVTCVVCRFDSDTWILFRAAFSVEAGHPLCKYVTVLANHNTETKTVDWVVANIRACS
ncbi:unknown protein [Seminavis robusta]|uniref:Uncharacterized protein n=1 Tax=Seminavis robusta TaxID=568900 RepID=A0A9N8DKX5_9STRA|nr:unknown protein [Seminavis robusta]|eukprot:Sro201_g084970.1 n/a (354) ;mRNA; f:18068-19129